MVGTCFELYEKEPPFKPYWVERVTPDDGREFTVFTEHRLEPEPKERIDTRGAADFYEWDYGKHGEHCVCEDCRAEQAERNGWEEPVEDEPKPPLLRFIDLDRSRWPAQAPHRLLKRDPGETLVMLPSTRPADQESHSGIPKSKSGRPELKPEAAKPISRDEVLALHQCGHFAHYTRQALNVDALDEAEREDMRRKVKTIKFDLLLIEQELDKES